MSKKPVLPRKYWTPKDHERLLDMHDAGATDAEIAAVLVGHTPHAVQLRRRKLLARTGGSSAYRVRDVSRIFGVTNTVTQHWLRMGWLVGVKSGMRRNTTANEWRISDSAIREYIADRRHWPRWNPERVTEAWQPFVQDARSVRLLSVLEVAERLGFERRAIQVRIKRGEIRAVGGDPRHKRPRALYIPEDELARITA